MNIGTINRALALAILTAGTALWAADPPATPIPEAPAPATPAVANATGPKIQFESLAHDFGRVKSGEVVKYTYIFTNTGDQVLELSGVQACGCITADFTRKVTPGQTGAVPISFNSANYGGPVSKAITVTCNDKANSRPTLQFTGTLWKPIDITPQYAVLNLTPDTPLASVTVTILNNLPEPITLSPPQCSNPAFAVRLTTNQPGKEFRVIVTPASPLPPGNTQAQISLNTSATNLPAITFTAIANVQPAISINPAQIALGIAPLARAQTNTISLINNSTNAITLSEPTVNGAGVEVELKEVVPGRHFAVTLTFPQGFENAPGQKAELTVKSSLPLMPLLKVPILQTPRPASPQVAPVKVSSTTSTNRHRVMPIIDLPPLPEMPPPRKKSK